MLRFQCRDCGGAARPECVEQKHRLCTLRQLRAEQAAPRLQQLQDAAASARKVVEALQGAMDAVEVQLQEWRGRLRQVEEAERELRAAVDEGRDADAVQVDGLELLQDAASLLEARCQLQVQKDGAEWKGDLQLAAVDGAVSLFGPLLAHLHQNRRLVKVSQPPVLGRCGRARLAMRGLGQSSCSAALTDAATQRLQVRQPDTTPAVPAFMPEECRNVLKLSTREEHGQEHDDFLVDPGLDQVRSKLWTLCLLLVCLLPAVSQRQLHFFPVIWNMNTGKVDGK